MTYSLWLRTHLFFLESTFRAAMTPKAALELPVSRRGCPSLGRGDLGDGSISAKTSPVSPTGSGKTTPAGRSPTSSADSGWEPFFGIPTEDVMVNWPCPHATQGVPFFVESRLPRPISQVPWSTCPKTPIRWDLGGFQRHETNRFSRFAGRAMEGCNGLPEENPRGFEPQPGELSLFPSCHGWETFYLDPQTTHKNGRSPHHFGGQTHF